MDAPPLQTESTKNESPQERVALELEKLRIEVRQLKKKPWWLDSVVHLLPIVAALVSVAAFVFTAYQYIAAQGKARQAAQIEQQFKLEAQARTNLEQIIQFPKEEKYTVTQIEFLLVDLDRLQRLLEKTSDYSREYAGHRRTTTHIIANLINRDMDFRKSRNVDFATAVLVNWEDYKTFLNENTGYVETILALKEDVLTEMWREAPDYFQRITFDQTEQIYHEPPGILSKRSQFREFEKLMRSFHEHLKLLSDQKTKDKRIKMFQAAICNPTLTEQVFGKKFDPQADPKVFEECLKPGKPQQRGATN